MDLAAVFALSLLGGYYFASYWRLTAFSTKREEGHHLYFRAALFGAVLFLLALLLRFGLMAASGTYARWDCALANYVLPVLKPDSGAGAAADMRRAEWVITAMYSLVLAPVCAWLLNLVTSRDLALRRAVRGLDKLLLQAQQLESPVAFTLSSGKVYIGLVVDAPDPGGDADVVTILPILSGYRNERGRLQLTTDYERLYDALESGRAGVLGLPGDWMSQFRLAIRIESLATAALFSPAIYAEFNPGWREKLGEQSADDEREGSAGARRSPGARRPPDWWSAIVEAVLALVSKR